MGANTKTDTRKRRDRGSISADEILKGAFDVAAQVSIDNLSMPVLAKHLDVGVTSIYWYFRRKDDLLDAMTDLALERFEFTVPTIDASNWRESLRDHARTMRAHFRDKPILCDLVLIRSQFGGSAVRGALQKIEQPIAALIEAGLDARPGRRRIRSDLGAHPRVGGAGTHPGQVRGISRPALKR